MVSPVPGVSQSTPYGKRGPYWSCSEDAYGNGIHTGADYACPAGTPVVAARGGRAVYCSHGSSFGYHQLEIVPGDGTRDFYAHMPGRLVADGAQVTTGQQLGTVGSEGNATGPHLHFERHSVATGPWSCNVVRDPAPSVNYQPAGSGSGASGEPEEDMPSYSRVTMSKPMQLKPDTWVSLVWQNVSGQAGKAGEAYLAMGDAIWTATLTAKVSTTGPIVTRFLERTQEASGWETSDTYPMVEHPATTGDTFIADTRTQKVAKGTRVIAQVNLKQGGTVESAEWDALYF